MSNYNFQSYSAQLTSYDEKPNLFYSHGATRSGHCDRRLFRQYVVFNFQCALLSDKWVKGQPSLRWVILSGSTYLYIFLSALLGWFKYHVT